MIGPRPRESLVELYCRYVRDPFAFWSGSGLRQAEKLARYKENLLADLGWPEDLLAERLLEYSMDRRSRAPVYVTGMGGSGSHWLGGMLGEMSQFFDADEVYFPKALLDSFTEEPDMARRVVDSLHLLHSREGLVEQERAVNCAAGAARTLGYKRWDPDAVVVYLVRDPRDQVLSTTFRKTTYRAKVARDLDDAEYLAKRCRINRSERWKYLEAGSLADVTTRYEDLRVDTAKELARVLEAAQETVDEDLLTHVARRYDADRIRAGDGEAVGNLNTRKQSTSWRDEWPGWVAVIHCELGEVIESLGYPFGECLGAPEDPEESFVQAVPDGIRLRGWDGEMWSRGAEGGPWLAEVLEASPEQLDWLADNPISGVCAARMESISDSWLESILENPRVRTLDLGTVEVTERQLDVLSRKGRHLTALNLWRAVPAERAERVRATLPRGTVLHQSSLVQCDRV